MYIVDAQLSLCTDVDQSLYTSTNPHLDCLVVTAPPSQDKKQSSSWSSYVADSVDLHTLGHETVAEHLNDAGKNSANSEVSLEEPEFVWTVLCQTLTQKSVRKADTNWTDQDSEAQKCVNCATVRNDDRVINVECTKNKT